MKKGYSNLLWWLSLVLDLLIISTIFIFYSDRTTISSIFLVYVLVSWVGLSIYTGFYKVYRSTIFLRLLRLLFTQLSLFFLAFFAFFSFFKTELFENPLVVFFTIGIAITLFKSLLYYALKIYRKRGKNNISIVVLGLDFTTKKIITLFNEKRELGYNYLGFFSDEHHKEEKYLGPLSQSRAFILQNQVDEIYCSLSSLKTEQIKMFAKFAGEHDKTLKLIPKSGDFYSKQLASEYFDNTLIVKVKKLPFDDPFNLLIKRIFDVVFSIFIIVFVLSWLTPLLSILIKLESKGPVFFNQEREGLNGERFTCYKFRSMKINELSDKVHATKNDDRVTKIGAFLRKTSIDESPQFFNVLLGSMSVVGPRPHMKSLSLGYQKEIDNYMSRHAVKPGITGLAQVSGYRGEVKKRADIKNRIRLDIFYIENWSFFLDLKIIIQTAANLFKGDQNAY